MATLNIKECLESSTQGGLAPPVNQVVYISYLDEAGITQKETHLVVAGIVVKDNQLKHCEADLGGVAADYIPKPDRDGFEFHAYDLFTGNGYFRNKREWPEIERDQIIERVLDILMLYDLPIIYGAIDKQQLQRKYSVPFDAHSLAFMLFAERVNRFVSRSNDACLLIADETRKKTIIKSSLRQYRKVATPIGNPEKLEHITDAVLFADSCDTWGLQVADFCNYFIKRHLIGGSPKAERFYQYFHGQIKMCRLFP